MPFTLALKARCLRCRRRPVLGAQVLKGVGPLGLGGVSEAVPKSDAFAVFRSLGLFVHRKYDHPVVLLSGGLDHGTEVRAVVLRLSPGGHAEEKSFYRVVFH